MNFINFPTLRTLRTLQTLRTFNWYSLPNTGITKADQNTKDNFDMQIFPNPAKDNAYLELKLPKSYRETLEIYLYNRLGKHISTTKLIPDGSGTESISLKSESLSSGTYFYEIKGECFSHVRQFIKVE